MLRTTIQEEVEQIECDYDRISCLAEGFRALADETRLRIVHLLMTRGEVCVCEFMPVLGLSQSNTSFHLKTLKYAGLITSRKQGKWMLYSLNRGAFEQLRDHFSEIFDVNKWAEAAMSSTRENAACRDADCQ